MVPALVCLLVMGAISIAVGAPFALGLRGDREGVWSLLADALVLGLAVIGLVAIAFGTFGAGAGIASGVAAVATGVGVAWWRGRPDLGPVRTWVPRGWSAAAAVLVVLAMALRLRTTYELPWISDMGGYLNWANQFARTGDLRSTWPPFYPAILAVPSALFGPAWTASIVPLFGLTLLAVVLRLAALLHVSGPLRLLTVLVVAASPHFVWYSTFPASEALQAPFLVASATVAAVAVARAPGTSRRLPAALVAASVLAAALSLNRAQAVAMVGPVLAVVVVARLGRSHARARRAGLWAAGSVLGLGVGYVFGINRIRPYYIDLQLRSLVPAGALDRAGDLGLLTALPATAAIVVVAAVIAALARWPYRTATRPRSRWASRMGRVRAAAPFVAGVLLAVVGVVALATHGTGEVDNAMARIGWGITVVAVLGLVVPRASVGVRESPVMFLGTSAVLFLVVQIIRFGPPKTSPIYLYWDRYFTSEFLPACIVLCAVGVQGLIEVAGRRSGRIARAVVVPAAAVAVLVLIATWVPGVVVQLRHESYDAAYPFAQGVVDRTDPADPVVWTADRPDGIVGMFQNTVWPFGAALSYTWGRTVVNLPSQDFPFVPEPVVSAAQVTEAVSCSATGAVSVVEWRYTADAVPVSNRLAAGLQWTARGSESQSMWLLQQGDHPYWTSVPLRADVYRVTVAPGTAAAPCPNPAQPDVEPASDR